MLNYQKRNRNKYIGFIMVVFLLLAGCTYPSAERIYDQAEEEKEPSFPPETSAIDTLENALATNSYAENAQRFWYTGWIANNIEKRRVTSMYSGAMIRPHGYIMDGRLAGVPFRYYRWNEHSYLWTEKTNWNALEKEFAPFDPFYGFLWWEPFFEQAVQLPNEKILSKDSLVYQIRLNGREWVKNSPNPIFEQIMGHIEQQPEIETVLEHTEVVMTIWIGNESFSKEEVKKLAKEKGADNDQLEQWTKNNYFIWEEENQVYKQQVINQYKTTITMPIPAAGYMEQEIFFRFYKYDDPGIKIAPPEKIEEYMKKALEE